MKQRYRIVTTLIFTFIVYNFSRQWSQIQQSQESSQHQVEQHHAQRVHYEVDPMHMHRVHDRYECKIGRMGVGQPRRFPAESKVVDRLPLPSNLSQLLIARTTIRTDLKILFLGDSLAWQFHNLWSEAINGTIQEVVNNNGNSMYSIAKEQNSSGIAVGYRLTDLFLNRTEEGIVGRLKSNKSWSKNETTTMLLETTANNKFDAMIYRIPLGWITEEDISEELFLESLQTAHQVFGVTCIVLVTPHFTNNVNTVKDWNALMKVRRLLSKVVREWEPSSEYGNLQHVVLFDFGRYTDLIMEENAKLIGYPTQGRPQQNYTMERLDFGCFVHPPSIIQACGELAVPGQCQCKRNMLSADGMHFCMSQVGGRMMAAWACTLSCVYNYNGKTSKNTANTNHCVDTCNRQFLSLSPFQDILPQQPA
jgi:hypothetical protein